MRHQLRILWVLWLILFASLSGLWGETPDWVIYYQQGELGRVADFTYYLGIGESAKSQEEADDRARIEFARSVETRVESSLEEFYSQQEGNERLNVSMATQVRTELSLKGIGITATWKESRKGPFYSLIRIEKTLYDGELERRLADDLRQMKADLERQEMEQESLRLAHEKELEEERHELERERLVRENRLEKKKLREERREVNRENYGDFLDHKPYPRLISFDNGEVFAGKNTLSGSFSLQDSMGLRTLSYHRSCGEFFQIGTSHVLNMDEFPDSSFVTYSDGDLKLALLNNNGNSVQISAAIGVRGYLVSPLDEAQRSEPGGTIYGAADVSVPQLLYNDFSLYAGLDKVALGSAWYPLHPFMGDSLAILGECSYVWNDTLKSGLNRSALTIQTGLQFHAFEFLCARLNWEDNFRTFALAVDLEW